MYQTVMKTEVTGITPSTGDLPGAVMDSPSRQPGSKAILTFSTPRKSKKAPDPTSAERFSTTPLSSASQRILLTPRKAPRIIAKSAYKVLDAPELQVSLTLSLIIWLILLRKG